MGRSYKQVQNINRLECKALRIAFEEQNNNFKLENSITQSIVDSFPEPIFSQCGKPKRKSRGQI